MYFTYSKNLNSNTNLKPNTIPNPIPKSKPEDNLFMKNDVVKYQMQTNMIGRVTFGLPCSGCKK